MFVIERDGVSSKLMGVRVKVERALRVIIGTYTGSEKSEEEREGNKLI